MQGRLHKKLLNQSAKRYQNLERVATGYSFVRSTTVKMAQVSSFALEATRSLPLPVLISHEAEYSLCKAHAGLLPNLLCFAGILLPEVHDIL
jgi:hypothetical protein